MSTPRRIFFRGRGSIASIAACGLILLGTGLSAITARAAPAFDVTVNSNQTSADFPNTLTFQLKIFSPDPIERIVLEYGVNQLSCGEVISKAFPDFQPGNDVSAEWTWDMRQSGPEPPGATVWWQWRVIDASGRETLVDRKETVWLDSEHPWQSLSAESVTVHWYRSDAGFGQQMMDAATKAVKNIRDLIDLTPNGPIDLYLYSTVEDMQASTLYEPEWSGGMSFGGYNLIILGIPPGEEQWGMGAIAHELMHTMVDDFTYSCLVHIPTWLHEGLAMVSEGGPGEDGMADLQNAIDQNTIFPLHNLAGDFPADSNRAALAYEESYSVVNFLIHQADASRVRLLLAALSEGKTIDDALQEQYGFTVDGLDAAWRKSVGASPLSAEETQPTATPTVVPTFHPLSISPAVPVTGSLTPEGSESQPAVTPAAGAGENQPSGNASLRTGETILILCAFLLCLGLIVIAAVILLAAASRRK